jgi:hypothetical protein
MADAVVHQIELMGRKSIAVGADVKDKSQVEKLVRETVSKLGERSIF